MAAQGKAKMRHPGFLVNFRDAQASDGFVSVGFQGDRPLVLVDAAINPAGYNGLRLRHGSVGVPGEIFGHLVVACPIAEHGLGILHGELPQDQPVGFDGFGALVIQHNNQSFLKMSMVWWLMPTMSERSQVCRW